MLAQGSQFSLSDVEVITATVDLEDVRSHRTAPSRGSQAVEQESYERIQTEISLGGEDLSQLDISHQPTAEIAIRYHTPEEEIA